MNTDIKYFEILSHTRDQFIKIGQQLGNALKEVKKNSPWILTVNGDHSGGKSLIALGVDLAFRPELYPNGITNNHSAEEYLKPNSGNPVIFENFRRLYCSDKSIFDAKLDEFKSANPSAQVLILCNIERCYFNSYSFKEKGLDSDKLDLGIDIFNPDDSLNRLRENSLLTQKFLSSSDVIDFFSAPSNGFKRKINFFINTGSPLTFALQKISESTPISQNEPPSLD